MRILFVTNTPLGLPSQASIQYYSTTLARLGYSVGIIGRQGGNTDVFHAAGVHTFEIANWSRNLTVLRNIANEFSPHVVHVNIHIGCGLYPIAMRTGAATKFVLDIRSPLLRTGVLRRLVQLKNYFEVLPYDAICAHGIESAWTVVGKRRNIHWLPPGMSIEEIAWQPHHSSAEIIRSIYVGSVNRPRQVSKMIEAVVQANQSMKIGLDIYGYGDELQAIEHQIIEAGLGERMQVKSLIPRHELFQRLSDYDLGLSYVPKRLYDAAPPLKTAEYLAAGLAVVATDTVGNRMFIRDGENGILAGETPTEFSNGLLRLASDAMLRTHVARHARPSVESFDWTAIVETHLLPLYERLVCR